MNGPAMFAKRAKIRLASSGEEVRPPVVDDNKEGTASTPNIISFGRRVMEEGYTFIWRRYENPILVSPKGQRILFAVEDYVPYICAAFEAREEIPTPASLGDDILTPTQQLDELI